MLSTDRILGTTVSAWTLLVLKGEDELPLIDETNLNRMESHDDDLDKTGSSLFGDNYVRPNLEQDKIDLDSHDLDGLGLDDVIDLRDEPATEDITFESAAADQDLAQETLVPAGLSLFDRDPGETAQPESISLDLGLAFAPAEAEPEFEQEPEFEHVPHDESGTGPDSPLFGSHKPLTLGKADQSIFDRGLTRPESTIAFVPAGDMAEPAWWRFPALVLISLAVVGFGGFQLFNLLSSPDGGDVATVKTPPTTVSVSTTIAEVPTTLAPTTVAPTTSAPATTAAPETTVTPTTAPVAAPTTRRPATTARPTTAAPTTEAPVTTAPTTVAPTTAPPPTFGTPAPAPTTADQTTEASE